MSGIIWLVVPAVALVWGTSLLLLIGLGVAAQRGDARVVAEDPWEALPTLHAWNKLRCAVAEAQINDERVGQDFLTWERELHLDNPGFGQPRPGQAA